MISTTSARIGLAILFFCAPLVQSQNNLYSGFTKKKDGLIDDIATTALSNDREIPLVGMGAGNLQHNYIENMIYEAINEDNRIRLIDTAHASLNEKLVARGIVTGVKRFKDTQRIDGRVQVHVVTKVWYTYLGYERTKISVQESLSDLSEAVKDPNVDLKVHFLLHWPRCYDTIQWMNCEEEEANLPDSVKQAGPAPHLDKETAWKDSWRALEDMYNDGDHPAIASIGVSNFDEKDMRALLDIARVPPHMIQINVWSLLFDADLVELCNQANIHIQLYNVMNGIVSNAFRAPYAHHHLLMVANMLHEHLPAESPTITGAQTMLKWLVQFGMSIIPRTTNLDRLHENSAVALAGVPDLSDEQLEIITQAAEAMLSGDDMEEDVYVNVTFKANEDMFLYFVKDAENIYQIAFIPKGESHQESTHPHHKFRLYHATNPDRYHDYVVQGKYGDHHDVAVEL